MPSSRSRRIMADMLREKLEVDTPSTSALSDIFSEEPPSLPVFVGDAKFLNNHPLGPIQYDFVRHFEQILYPETYILMVEEFGEYWSPVRMVNKMVAQWGKGSGKDHCCQISFARVANILLSMRSPQEYFGMSHQTIIHLLNVAWSSKQAHGVFFKPLRTLITTSPWFEDKFESDLEPGPQAQEIRFKKQIELISGHSESDSLEGKNLIAGIADEISAFPTLAQAEAKGTGRDPSRTADGIIEMLQSSATTRFTETYKLAQISYPRSKGDAIQQATMLAEADISKRGDQSTYYSSGPYATWLVNPRFDKFERITIPGATEPIPNVASIVEDYESKPAYARAKYECKPERSQNVYFKNTGALFASFQRTEAVEPLSFDYRLGIDTLEGEQVVQWQVDFNFADNFLPVPGAIYAIHADMAITGDRAGISMAHVSEWQRKDVSYEDPRHDIATERHEALPVVKIDFVTAFEADEAAQDGEGNIRPREVQIRWFRKLVSALLTRGFAIGSVTMDGFQSADSLQIMAAQGLEAKKQSMDRDLTGWKTLRDVMYDGRLDGYWHPLVVEELQSLSQLGNGKVDHPIDGSKDCADALAGAVLGAVTVGGEETPGSTTDFGTGFGPLAITQNSEGEFGLFGESVDDDMAALSVFGRSTVPEEW